MSLIRGVWTNLRWVVWNLSHYPKRFCGITDNLVRGQENTCGRRSWMRTDLKLLCKGQAFVCWAFVSWTHGWMPPVSPVVSLSVQTNHYPVPHNLWICFSIAKSFVSNYFFIKCCWESNFLEEKSSNQNKQNGQVNKCEMKWTGGIITFECCVCRIRTWPECLKNSWEIRRRIFDCANFV